MNDQDYIKADGRGETKVIGDNTQNRKIVSELMVSGAIKELRGGARHGLAEEVEILYENYWCLTAEVSALKDFRNKVCLELCSGDGCPGCLGCLHIPEIDGPSERVSNSQVKSND